MRRRSSGLIDALNGLLEPSRTTRRPPSRSTSATPSAKPGITIPANVSKVILDGRRAARPRRRRRHRPQGHPLPDPDLRDNENVPLSEDIDDYMKREVLPHVPDAWVDDTKTKIGYEIPFTRHFYRYTPPRPLAEIDADIAERRDRDPAGARQGWRDASTQHAALRRYLRERRSCGNAHSLEAKSDDDVDR